MRQLDEARSRGSEPDALANQGVAEINRLRFGFSACTLGLFIHRLKNLSNLALRHVPRHHASALSLAFFVCLIRDFHLPHALKTQESLSGPYPHVATDPLASFLVPN